MAKRKKGFKRQATKEIRPSKEYREIYNETVKLQREANRRLTEIQREFGEGSWAGKRLERKLTVNELDAWSFDNKVLVPKNLDKFELKAVNKALTYFLESKTSTVKGIKDVIKQQKENIKSAFEDEEGEELSEKEIESLYDLMGDEDFKTVAENTDPSSLRAFVQEARERKLIMRDFRGEVENYVVYGEDEDLKKNINRIWRKYIRDYR